MATTSGLKNINLLTKTQYDGAIIASNELYAVRADTDTDFKSFVAGCAMPNSKNTTLTAGSSGTTYTAPANGYFFTRVKATSASSSWATLKNNKSSIVAGLDHSRSSANFYGCVPALKGDTVTLQYGSATVEVVIFIYAEGEQ